MLFPNLFLVLLLSKHKGSMIHAKLLLLFFIFMCKLLFINALPIDTIFKFPSPLPSWGSGGGFGAGVIDLGGFEVRQIPTFNKVWTTNQGGPDNLGATFFEPSSIPDGFSMLGSYAQPNNQPLFGWVLVGKINSRDQLGDIVKEPVDYTLVWSNTQTSPAYFWLPTPPDGYKAVGYIVTTSPEKPPLNKILCVRYDFAADPEIDNWIWAQGGVEVVGLRPKDRGNKAQALSVGAFLVQNTTGDGQSSLPLSCLKNNNFTLSTMPNLSQIEALVEAYSPFIYFHPKESHLPSSVNWYFSNGAVLYKKGEESNPIPIQPNGTNLPQGGSCDGLYWLDLPVDGNAKEKVKNGDLQSAESYILVKPMLGAIFTDIQVWLFYPFNGHATAKLKPIKELSLGRIGEHVGDWEHVTLRISNFDGVLYKVYFAEHGGGTWVDSSLLEFQKGNKFVGYASLNGHATYYAVQRVADMGLRCDTAKSDKVMDTGARFSVVAADVGTTSAIVEPAWLNYAREWGPKINYDLDSEVKRIRKLLLGPLKSDFDKMVRSLPKEVYGQEGPTGPKMKESWSGDEK